MMLSNYKGPSNSAAMFEHLVGSKIVAVIEEGPVIALVFDDKTALVLTSFGGESRPCFWVECGRDLQNRINRRYSEIVAHLAQLGELTKAEEVIQSAQ